jgi:hypothetical protein
VIENGIDLMRGLINHSIDLLHEPELNKSPHLRKWNPNQPSGYARFADDRSPKSVQKANAFVVSLIWVF